MPRSKIWLMKVSRALPPGDPRASLIARALVLWADLLVEQPGVHEDSGLRLLERTGVVHRRMYFMRGLSRSLSETIDLANAIAKSKDFSALFAKHTDLRATFNAARVKLRADERLIRLVRNRIGAHVGVEVGAATATIPPTYGVRMEFHSEDGLRPQVAEWLLLAALFDGSPEDELERRFLGAQSKIHDATSVAIALLAAAVDAYAKEYPLFPE